MLPHSEAWSSVHLLDAQSRLRMDALEAGGTPIVPTLETPGSAPPCGAGPAPSAQIALRTPAQARDLLTRPTEIETRSLARPTSSPPNEG